jgi:hypothetical protein
MKRALGSKAPPLTEYRTALQASANMIADYTAARITLSLARVQILPLSELSRWWKSLSTFFNF